MPASLVSCALLAASEIATYPCTVWRCTPLLIVVSHFVEVILVELANKTGEVAVLEVFRQDVFREALVLCDVLGLPGLPLPSRRGADLEHDKAVAFIAPSHYALVLRALQHSGSHCQ